MRYHCTTGLDDDLIAELVGRVRQVLTGRGLDESPFALDFDAQVEGRVQPVSASPDSKSSRSSFSAGLSQLRVSRGRVLSR